MKEKDRKRVIEIAIEVWGVKKESVGERGREYWPGCEREEQNIVWERGGENTGCERGEQNLHFISIQLCFLEIEIRGFG